MHCIWRKVRRPFLYPACTQECKWEVYDATLAGCLKCGAGHVCKPCAFEGKCPLENCDDGSRVCTITGYVLPEVRYSSEEYLDTICFDGHNNNSNDNKNCFNNSANSRHNIPIHQQLDTEITKCIDRLLSSSEARRCRKEENSFQGKRLYKNLMKSIKHFKMRNPDRLPNMCDLLTSMMYQEKRLNFVHPASTSLKERCAQNILVCLLDLKQKGLKVHIGNKLQDLVCGLMYLLRTGISYNNYELLAPIPEIAQCLPIETRLKNYFNINSKVITSVENEVKLAFRDYHQRSSLSVMTGSG